jgi:hypothetical protein
MQLFASYKLSISRLGLSIGLGWNFFEGKVPASSASPVGEWWRGEASPAGLDRWEIGICESCSRLAIPWLGSWGEADRSGDHRPVSRSSSVGTGTPTPPYGLEDTGFGRRWARDSETPFPAASPWKNLLRLEAWPPGALRRCFLAWGLGGSFDPSENGSTWFCKWASVPPLVGRFSCNYKTP